MDESSPRSQYEFKPCRHMERWVDALADGSLRGWRRWYAQMHISGCNQCRATLERLQRVRQRLQAYRAASDALLPASLPPEKRLALDAALDAIEQKRFGN